MAFKIPDFAAVGFDDPRAVGGLPTFPANDPGAAGLGVLGKGVQDLGGAFADLAYQRDKLSESNATLDLFTRLSPLQTKIDLETDTDKIAEHRQEINALLQTSGQAIDNPARQKAWMASHAKTILEANSHADKRTTLLYRNKSTAASNVLLDRVTAEGVAKDDAQAFVIALQGIDTNLEYQVANGNKLPEAAYEEGKRRRKELVEGRVLNLISKGKTVEAQALLDTRGDLIGDSIQRERFSAQIKAKAETIGVDAAANRALGLAPALPARRPSGSIVLGGAISQNVERFLDLTERHESGGRNIMQQAVPAGGGFNPSTGTVTGPSSAQGHFQITNTTWKEFAPQAGIDTNQYSNAMAAPYDVQRQVARTIATTSGVQHWTNFNKDLRAAVQREGMPVSGPISGGPEGASRAAEASGQPAGPDAVVAQPAAVAQPAPPNRTGLPSLAEAERAIASDPALTSDHARALAFDRAKIKYNALEADAARAERIATETQKAAVNARITAIQKDAYSDNPTISARDIINDPTFNSDPKLREHMIGFINNPPGSGVPAPQSYAAALRVIEHIRLPEGDPQKITDLNQIYDPLVAGKLNKDDFNFAVKQFNDIRTPGGELFNKRKTDFLKSVEASIDKSNPLMGKMDPSGKQQLYGFHWLLDQKIDEYRKAGKNPADLLDPSKPEFMGKPATLEPYQKTLQQSTADKVKALTGDSAKRMVPTPEPPSVMRPGPGATAIPGGISVPIPPMIIQPRKPGETPDEYLRRLGQ